jgi:hypothetical protein
MLGFCSLLLLLATPAVAAADDTGKILPLPEAEMLRRLEHDDFSVVSSEAAGGGVMGARKLELRFEDGTTIDAKWKVTPAQAEGWNNSPRHEIGAYAVQKLFLEPGNYLVPPIAVRCIPLAEYHVVEKAPNPNLAGTHCVFGALAAWLHNVYQPDPPFDRERFSKDPHYAFHFANLNLLHYLIDHRDGRYSNFLMAKDADDARVFSIDNGIAFSGLVYNFLSTNYNTIRVSAVPKASIDRLRQIRRADLDQLGMLGQLEADSDGVLRNVAPTANVDPDQGTRHLPNGGIQFGLTRSEIDAIEDRLRALLKMVHSGELPVF